MAISPDTTAESRSRADAKPSLGVKTDNPGAWVLTNRTVDASGRVVALPSSFGACLPSRPPDQAGRA